MDIDDFYEFKKVHSLLNSCKLDIHLDQSVFGGHLQLLRQGEVIFSAGSFNEIAGYLQALEDMKDD